MQLLAHDGTYWEASQAYHRLRILRLLLSFLAKTSVQPLERIQGALSLGFRQVVKTGEFLSFSYKRLV